MNEVVQALLGDSVVKKEDVLIAQEKVRALFMEEEEYWLEDALRKAWPKRITERAGSQVEVPALRQRIVAKRGPEDDRIIAMKAFQERSGRLQEAYLSTFEEARKASATSEAITALQQTADVADVGQIASQLERLEVDVPANAQQESSQSAKVEEDSDIYNGPEVVPERKHGLDATQ